MDERSTAGRRHLNRELQDWLAVRHGRAAVPVKRRKVAMPKKPRGRPNQVPEHPERDAEIVRRVAARESMEAISKDYGLTRERVRQIAKRDGLTGTNPCVANCGRNTTGGDYCWKCGAKIKKWGSLERPPNKTRCTCGKCRPGKQAPCYMRRLYAENPERRKRVNAATVAWTKKTRAGGGEKAARLRENQRRAHAKWAKKRPEKYKEYRQRRNEKRKERFANDPEFRAAELARLARIQKLKRERHKERFATDPEYAEKMREYWRQRAARKKEAQPSESPS